MNNFDLNQLKRKLKRDLGAESTIKVRFVESNDPPKIVGDYGYYIKGYGGRYKQYVKSTRTIEVGLGCQAMRVTVRNDPSIIPILLNNGNPI